MTTAVADLALSHLWVIYPGRQSYPLSEKITVIPFSKIGPEWDYGGTEPDRRPGDAVG